MPVTRLSATLAILVAGAALGAGSVPGVSVRFLDGKLYEIPTGKAETLVQDDLYPDYPFHTPLPAVPLDQFRGFLGAGGPKLALSAAQLSEIHFRAATEPAVKASLDALIAEAEKLLEGPVPRYQPSPFHWIQAPLEESREAEEQAARLTTIRGSCALAFALTGEERFARRAWEAFQANVEHLYTYGVFRMPFSWQSPWDSGYELYDAAAAYDLISHWEALAPLDHALVFTYLRRLGLRVAYAVELSPVIGSQQALWTCNLGCLAYYAPAIPEAASWRELVDERIESVMADFMTDGGHIECDPAAHSLALEHLLRYARVRAAGGDPDFLSRPWGAGRVTLERCVDWLAKIATPLGETPALGDSPCRPLALARAYLDGIRMFRRADWLTAGRIDPTEAPVPDLLPADLVSTKPQFTSLCLPDTGFAVLRDGWDVDDGYLLLDYGRHGGPFGHFDRLGFTLYANGQPWVLDAGPAPNPSLHAELHQSWHRQTRAHNTVMIDESSQSASDGKLTAWQTHPAFDLVAAEQEGYPDAIHRRTVFHPRDGYFLVFDEIANCGDIRRELQWLAHVNGTRESGTVGRIVLWRENRQGLALVPPREGGLRGVKIDQGLCTGCDGILANIQPGADSGSWTPGSPGWGYIPSIGLRKSVAPRSVQTFCVALVPFVGKEPEVTVESFEGKLAYGVRVISGDTVDLLVIRKRGVEPGTMSRDLPVATNARYAFVRERAGKTTVMEWVDGDSLWIERDLRTGR